MDKQTKKPTTKNSKILDYINSIAVKGLWDDGYGNTMDIWCSKIDGSFITSDSDSGLKDVTWMLTHGITEQVQATDPTDPKVSCIGFNPVEQKWYGWSHRAFYGFGIGSEVKKGHCGYIPKDFDDFLEQSVNFWKDESHTNVAGIKSINDEGIEGVQITWDYVTEKVPNKDLHGTIGSTFMYPHKNYGKGEWKAETLEDAKQMAIDFAEGVS